MPLAAIREVVHSKSSFYVCFTFCEDFASRDIELEKNVNYVLAGLRRAGKTTLLYQRVQNIIKDGVAWDQIIYISFDDIVRNVFPPANEKRNRRRDKRTMN